MVMINQFDLIGDTDIDDPLQIALRQIEILSKKAAAAAAAAEAAKAEAAKAKAEAAKAKAKAEAAKADADLEFPVEEAQKGVLALPEGDLPYQDRRGQNGPRRGSGRNFESNRNVDGFSATRRGSGRNFESNRNVDGFSAIPDDSIAQDLLGKPSIRGHSDQPYRGRDGGRGRGYLNRDNGEYAGRPARRQYERQSGVSSPPAKVNGELYPLVKDVPVPHVELGLSDEQNLKENATSEGKSSNPHELDNAPTSNALNKNKEGMANGKKEKKPVAKLMTLEEYQKVLEGKRKNLVAKLMLKKTQEQERKVDVIKTTQERKVDVDKEFESMQQLVVRKENNEFFIKLGNDKEAGKRKEDTVGAERVKKETVGDEVKKDTDRVERVKKVFRKFEFLRPAEGRRGGRGGHGGQDWRGGRGGFDVQGGGQGWRGGQGGVGVQGGLDVQGGRGGKGWHGGRGGQGWLGGQGGLDGQGEPGGQGGGRGGQGWRGGQGGLGVQGGLDGQGECGGQGGLGVQGGRGGGPGGHGYSSSFSEESIKDPRQFPELGAKEVEQRSSAQGKKVEQQQQQQHSSAAQGRK